MKTWEVLYDELIKGYEADTNKKLSDEAKEYGKVCYVLGKIEGILTGHLDLETQMTEIHELFAYIEHLSINIHFKNNNLFN